MPTRVSDRQRRARQKIHTKTYLAELGGLFGREVFASELHSLESSDAIRQAAQGFLTEPSATCEFDAQYFQPARFEVFIHKLSVANSSPVSVWIAHSIDCGALALPSLRAARFSFEFLASHGSLLSVVTSDLKDRLLLDFVDSNAGTRHLRIETQGAHWRSVSY